MGVMKCTFLQVYVQIECTRPLAMPGGGCTRTLSCMCVRQPCCSLCLCVLFHGAGSLVLLHGGCVTRAGRGGHWTSLSECRGGRLTSLCCAGGSLDLPFCVFGGSLDLPLFLSLSLSPFSFQWTIMSHGFLARVSQSLRLFHII